MRKGLLPESRVTVPALPALLQGMLESLISLRIEDGAQMHLDCLFDSVDFITG